MLFIPVYMLMMVVGHHRKLHEYKIQDGIFNEYSSSIHLPLHTEAEVPRETPISTIISMLFRLCVCVCVCVCVYIYIYSHIYIHVCSVKVLCRVALASLFTVYNLGLKSSLIHFSL